MTIEAKSFYAVPSDVADSLYVTQEVSAVTGVPVDQMRNAYSAAVERNANFVYLARQVEPDVAEQLIALKLPGVYAIDEPKRIYPQGEIPAQVVGLSDIDGNGIEGLESEYDSVLKGTPGSLVFERASGSGGTRIPQAHHQVVPAVPGDDLYTTLDSALTYVASQACADAVQRTHAKSCWVVALQPETGEVLALAGAPAFDPALRVTIDGGPFTNAVIRDQYEPGSTQKLITISAALDTGSVGINTVIPQVGDHIEINEGACRSADDEIRGCYADAEKHQATDMMVKDIFAQSSNVGTIKIASRLPQGVLERYMERFGFGSPTGVDFTGEAHGQIKVDPGCSTCLASQAIGYGVAVTPLQLAAAYGAVANDGVWVQPHLVGAQVDGNGAHRSVQADAHRVVSDNTASAMRELLGMVVTDGTGTEARVEGYRVGGKTGTASKLGADGKYGDDNIASFVGMAPLNDPKVVVAVVVDSPAYEFRFGGLAAAPVFSEVMKAALQRLGVPPDGVVTQ
jgi:cell division protein FtsI/penicillin-binding protein 2